MSVTLLRAYKGAAAAATPTFQTAEENSLIAQGLATTLAVASITSGAQTVNNLTGVAAVAIGASSVVITNALVDANSVIFAVVRQAAADGTALRVERIVPAAGSFTIHVTANATAATLVMWAVLVPGGLTAPVFNA